MHKCLYLEILDQRAVIHRIAGMKSSFLHFPSVGVVPAVCPVIFQRMPAVNTYERHTTDYRMGTGHMTLEGLCDPACTNDLHY